MKYLLLLFLSFHLFAAQKRVAEVKKARNKVSAVSSDGKLRDLKKEDVLFEGDVVKTGARSVAKIKFFHDQTMMTVGPKSELKIEKISKTEPGVINVLSGKIKAKVSKDYLRIKKDKSKLFMKSKSAIMGIRGTEFVFNVTKNDTAVVMTEGLVRVARLPKNLKYKDFDKHINNSGVSVPAGSATMLKKGMNKFIQPFKVNPKQLKTFKSDAAVEGDLADGAKKKKDKAKKKKNKMISVVPPGLPAELAAGDNQVESSLSTIANVDVKSVKKEAQEMKKEMKSDDRIKTIDGSVISLDQMTVVPPTPDKVFDKTTDMYVEPNMYFDEKGEPHFVDGNYTLEGGAVIKNVDGQKIMVVENPLTDTGGMDRVDQEVARDEAPASENKNKDIIIVKPRRSEVFINPDTCSQPPCSFSDRENGVATTESINNPSAQGRKVKVNVIINQE